MAEAKPNVICEIANSLKGRKILDTATENTQDGRYLYWGISGGTTIRIHVKGKVKQSWEEIPEPLGVVAKRTVVS